MKTKFPIATLLGAIIVMASNNLFAETKNMKIAPSEQIVATPKMLENKRPCDFTAGITMPVPTSANETVENIAKKQATDRNTQRPRLSCVKEMTGEKLRILLSRSFMGMQNGRAGIFVTKLNTYPER